jgi:enoyl-CoA hydratase/carnithine racemase
MSDPVRMSRDDAGVSTVELVSPPLNAFDTAMRRALDDAVAEIGEDEATRAVVVTGGEKIFAAGADIAALAEMDYEAVVVWNRALQRTFTGLAELRVPVIAAVNGYALGGGMELALAADYRIASSGASLGQPEVLLGILPGSGGTQRLTRLVGTSRSKELLMTGRRLHAAEALALGIVDEVVEGDAYPAAVAFARRLAAGPRFAIQAIKQAVDHGLDGSLEAGLALERSLIAGLFATEDKQVGMASFQAEGPGRARFT